MIHQKIGSQSQHPRLKIQIPAASGTVARHFRQRGKEEQLRKL